MGALSLRGLAHIDPGEKEVMRRLVLDNAVWSHAERQAILDYCASDVAALIALLPDGVDDRLAACPPAGPLHERGCRHGTCWCADRHDKRRALAALENAGLIRVQRARGRSMVVELT
jgi:hypothetical protein